MSAGKKAASKFAAANYVATHHKVIGIGSGSTIVEFVNFLSEKVLEKSLDIVCVPTSYQAKDLIRSHNLKLGSIEESYNIDIAFDGADELTSKSEIIKGGGGCLMQEKIVASCAKKFIILADESKISSNLGLNWTKGIPIEVLPMCNRMLECKIVEKFGGTASTRQGVNKVGPVVTDNGNFIIDWKFDANLKHDWLEIDDYLHKVPGIIETGLFLKMADKAILGRSDGSCQEVVF